MKFLSISEVIIDFPLQKTACFVTDNDYSSWVNHGYAPLDDLINEVVVPKNSAQTKYNVEFLIIKLNN